MRVLKDEDERQTKDAERVAEVRPGLRVLKECFHTSQNAACTGCRGSTRLEGTERSEQVICNDLQIALQRFDPA